MKTQTIAAKKGNLTTVNPDENFADKSKEHEVVLFFFLKKSVVEIKVAKVKSTPPSGPSDPVDSEGDDDDDDTFSSSCPPMESDSVKTSEVKSMLRRWNSRRDQRNLWVPFALKTSMVIVGSTLAGDG